MFHSPCCPALALVACWVREDPVTGTPSYEQGQTTHSGVEGYGQMQTHEWKTVLKEGPGQQEEEHPEQKKQ
jgi:hypothetical protein